LRQPFPRTAFVLVLAVPATLAAGPAGAQTSLDPHALFAQEELAVGGTAWQSVAAVAETGVSVSGGGPSTFSGIVSRASGYSKTVTDSGPLHDVSGFDGLPWDSQNGGLVTIDLPGIVADAVTQAYVDRDGWWQPTGATMTYDGEKSDGALDADVVTVVPDNGSGIDVWIDRRTHLIARTVAHTDTGDVTSTDDDYRTVDGTKISFHDISIDPTGAKTETTLKTVTLDPTFDIASIARPVPDKLASFAGPSPVVVPFRFDAHDTGHLIVSATFGTTTVPVFFDSGGAAILTPEVGKSLSLATGGGAEIGGVGNASVAASFANVGTLAIGGAQLAKQTALILPLPYGLTHPCANVTVDGLVGAEILENFKTTVDYAAQTMAFAPFDATVTKTPFTIPYYSDGAHAYVHATIDGAVGLFGVDTGDGGGLTVFRRFANAHHLYAGPGDPFVSPGGIGGKLPGAFYRGTALTLSATTLQAPVVSVSDATAGAFASKSVAGNIGARILARFTVVFDYAHHVISFKPNAHVNDRFIGDRTGLSLTQTVPGYFAVLFVAPGSPAAAAGIRAGDRVLAVNGVKVSPTTLGYNDLHPIFIDLKRKSVTLRIQRGTAEQMVTIYLRELV